MSLWKNSFTAIRISESFMRSAKHRPIVICDE
nr:MAG TPA: hypothetical protein [Caudoviricetes sp.]DAQ85564.1 MAG TPA: hypothetical protein [Caudoviricetes sp.]